MDDELELRQYIIDRIEGKLGVNNVGPFTNWTLSNLVMLSTHVLDHEQTNEILDYWMNIK